MRSGSNSHLTQWCGQAEPREKPERVIAECQCSKLLKFELRALKEQSRLLWLGAANLLKPQARISAAAA